MIALVLAPAGTSAASTSGQVVKNMAVKMFSRGMLNNISTYTSERKENKPTVSATDRVPSGKVVSSLGITGMKRVKGGDGQPEGLVPDVRGYELAAAVRMLEKQGLNVRTIGAGHVAVQSRQPGTAYRRGDEIVLTLRN